MKRRILSAAGKLWLTYFALLIGAAICVAVRHHNFNGWFL